MLKDSRYVSNNQINNCFLAFFRVYLCKKRGIIRYRIALIRTDALTIAKALIRSLRMSFGWWFPF